MDGIRTVPMRVEPPAVETSIVGEEFRLKRATDEDGTRYDQINVFWRVPKPSGKPYRMIVQLPRALSEQLAAATFTGAEIVDAIFDAARPEAEAAFNRFWEAAEE